MGDAVSLASSWYRAAIRLSVFRAQCAGMAGGDRRLQGAGAAPELLRAGKRGEPAVDEKVVPTNAILGEEHDGCARDRYVFAAVTLLQLH